MKANELIILGKLNQGEELSFNDSEIVINAVLCVF